MPLVPDFPATISRYVHARDESQDSIARGIGVSRQALQAWMTGDARPNRERMTKAAAYFGLPLSTFWLDEMSSGMQERMLERYQRFVASVEDLIDQLYEQNAKDLAGERVDQEKRRRRRGA